MKKWMLLARLIMFSLTVNAKINKIPVVKKGDVIDIICFDEKDKPLLQYENISSLSEKEEIITFKDRYGNPHVLTKEGICNFTKK